MSNKTVEELETHLLFANDLSIHDWIDNHILHTKSKFLPLCFFRKCSKQILAYQDDTYSSIMHGLVKSKMSSLDKMKSLKVLLTRDVNCNKPDGNGKVVLDYLIKDNEYNCIEVLLQYGRDVKVSENCLSKAFQLRNEQEEVFRLIFAYAIKHKVAPHLTGVSDGDTFLHKIILCEKEKASFKKWMGYFLTFSDVNISAVNNDGLTVIDLLFRNCEKKRCKRGIKLLIKYRCPNISDNGLCFKLPMFSLTPDQKDLINCLCKKAIKNENLLLKNVGTTDDNKTNFSHKYLKLKQTASWSSTKSSHIPKKSSQNSSTSLLNLPNHEENEILFKIEISGKARRENKTKSTQKSLTKNAKAKKYLSSEEAVAYRNLIGGKNSKMLFFCTQMTLSGGYIKSKETREFVSISKVFQQLLQKSSIILCRITNVIKSSKCRKLGQGSYGTVYDAVNNQQTHVAKTVSPCIAERINKKFLKEIDILRLDHPNFVQLLTVPHHKNTPLVVIKEKIFFEWLGITNPSSNLRNKLTDVTNVLKDLYSQNVVYSLNDKDKTKNYDFGIDKIEKNVIQLLGNLFHMPPAFNPVYNEKLYIFSFSCVVIYIITHGCRIVDTTFKLKPILLQDYASEASSKTDERTLLCNKKYPIKTSENKEVDFSYVIYLFGASKSKKFTIAVTIVGHIFEMKTLQKFLLPCELMKYTYPHRLVVINCTTNHFYIKDFFKDKTFAFSFNKVFLPYLHNCVELLKDDTRENTVKLVASKSKFSTFTAYGLSQYINNMDIFHKMIIMPFLVQNYISLNRSCGLKGCTVDLQGEMCLVPYHRTLLDRQNGGRDKQFNKEAFPQLTHLHQIIKNKKNDTKFIQTKLVEIFKISLQNHCAFLNDIYKKYAELAAKFKSLGANLKCVLGKLKTYVSVEIVPDPEASFSDLRDLINGIWQDLIDAVDYFQLAYDNIITHMVQQFNSLGVSIMNLLVGYITISLTLCVMVVAIGFRTISLASYFMGMNRNKYIKELNISNKRSTNCYPTISLSNQYLKPRLTRDDLRTTYVLKEPVAKESVLHKIRLAKAIHLIKHGSSLASTHTSKNDVAKWKNMALAGEIKDYCIVEEFSGCSLHKNQESLYFLFYNLTSFQGTLQSVRYLPEDQFGFSGYRFMGGTQFAMLEKYPAFLRYSFEKDMLQFKILPSFKNKAPVAIDVTDGLKYLYLTDTLSTNLLVKIYYFEMADKLSRNTIKKLHGNFSYIPPVYSKKLDTSSFGWLLFQINKPKFSAVNITPFCSEIVEPFKMIAPVESVNRVDGYESHYISCLEKISFTMINELSIAQSCHLHFIKECDSLLNVLYFLALMHYLKFVPAFNWQVCELVYHWSYENICNSQKRMIFYFYTIYKHLCKRVLLRRKWVFLELPPIPLVIILTNKSLLHESKLVNLLQHDLSSIYLFVKVLQNVHNKVLNYTPLNLWTVIYEFCKKEIKSIERKCVSKHKIYFGCSCYEVEKLPKEKSTLHYEDINNDDINNDSIKSTLLQSTSLQHLHPKAQAPDILMLPNLKIALNHENDDTSCGMMDEITISFNQVVLEKVMKTAQISTNNTVCALKGKEAYAILHSLKTTSVLTAPNVIIVSNHETALVMGIQLPYTTINGLVYKNLGTTNLQTKSEIEFSNGICDVEKSNLSQGLTSDSKLNSFEVDYTITDEQKPYLNEKSSHWNNQLSKKFLHIDLLLQELHHPDCCCMQQAQEVLPSSKPLSTETESEGKTNSATTDECLFYQLTNSRCDIDVKVHISHNTDDETSIPYQVVNDSFQHANLLYVTTTHLQVFEESNSEETVDTCVNDLTESLSFRVNGHFDESESCDSLHSSNTLFISTSLMECISISNNGQESFQHVGKPSESPSLNVMGQRICSPFHVVPTIPCCSLSVIALQDSIISEKENSRTRGSGGGHDEDSFIKCESCESYKFPSNTIPFLSNGFLESSTHGQESFQHVGKSSLNVMGQRVYSPFHAVPTILCSSLSINVTPLQDGVLSEKEKSRTREFGGGHNEDSFVECESCNSLYRFPSSTTSFLSNSFPELSTHGHQHVGEASESFSLKVIGKRIFLPFHAVPTIPCGNLSVNETVFQNGVLTKQHKNKSRGFGDGSSDSSSDEDNNGEDKRGIHTSLVSHYHSHNPQQHSLPHSPRYHSMSAAVNTSITPQTAAGTSLIRSKHDGRMREVATAKPFVGMGVMLPKSPAMYTSKGEYLISDSLNERGPILLDIPNGRNELVMAAYSTQSIPKLYPIVGLRKELPGIALPPPIPLDLPKLHPSKKMTSIASHQHVVKEQPVKSGFDVRTVPEAVQQPQYMASVGSHQQQKAPLSQSMDFSDPVIIIDRAALFLTAGDYGATIKVLEILDKHLVLPDDIDMAKEFGQGLANYKNLHYKAAKTCFTALFDKSINYHSPGNQALASIYLGEIEMSWGKYNDAEKHFTIAVANYNPDNVAEKYQQIILTKSAVLVKKGQCHRSLSQIKEAINAFKMAKEVAELAQLQARGSKLKTAKEDELSAVCALGNILQSIGDYDQSFEYYEKSLKLAGELGDQVSIGWAHGNLGNAMLGLDQKDRALDHLITAFYMSARYEGNPLAVGRAVSNLGNAYQAIGNLKKAKEHYEIALGHAIYGNDLQGQGRACGNIGNIYMLMKEPVQAVHYYTETLRLSTDRNTKITGHHNRGCARFDVAECIIQGKKPKELVPATTQDSEYGRLTIKLTDEVITTDPVQETKPNRDPSAQSISEQKESSISVEMLPVVIKGKAYEGVASVEIVRIAEALPFLETAQRDLLEAIESHEQSVQNVKGSHEALSLSLSLFESNSRSFYKIQETFMELGKLYQRLSKLGLIDMTATEPQEFKDALVYGEQARARTLGELILQKKKTMYSDLFSISTPLTIQDIYKAVKLQKYPIIFLSYCVSKLLMWILVPVKDEVIMRCQSVELKEENLENNSFELYIRYNLLQFLSKDEIYIFRRSAYEQESPFTILHDVIGIKIIEGLKSVGCSEVTEFIVIPDSVTHLLPFSPLMNKHNWQFFGDKYRIRIVPSFLSLLVMSVTSNPVVEIPGDKSDFLIVGNPTIPQFMYDSTPWNLGRLPYAEKEAISVASVLETIPVLREQATKQSVLYRLRSAKVIHLATHGSASAGFLAFTSSFPVSKSGLAEKEHILIFPKEIETLNISPALVVLSSCDSARGPVKAEGVIGMARAFLSAGAHSVLVSLWRVPDESAHVFMKFFYQFLVNGLPSLQALQRSMQCLRCFLKYSHYVHWSGFQIIGKEVTFHKDSNAQFPIQNMLGEISIFPRQHVKSMEENLLGVKNKIFTDVQMLVGTPGNEPEECARDFIKNCYYYYPCGVYWYDSSNELLLETTMKVAHQTPLMGGIYKEQKDLDPLPTISNPSLLSTKSSKPMSRKEKKLIVLNNFTSLETCACIIREMKDASTDIIVVSNELFCKEEIAKEFDKNFNRGCNIIEVTNLDPISIMQRMVYGLLEKKSFVARDADHIVFTLLSEYSRGAATIVHMLASLMQNSDDNNRTGFELAKQQLKLHIAHRTLEKDLGQYSMQDTLSEARSIANASEKVQNRGGDVVTETKFQIDHASDAPDYSSFSAPRGLEHPNEMFDVKTTYADDNKKQSNISDATSSVENMGTKTDEISKSPITIVPEGYSTKTSCSVDNKKQSDISDATSGFESMGSKTDEISKSPITIVPEGYSTKTSFAVDNQKQSNISDATSVYVCMGGKNDDTFESPIAIITEGYIMPEGYTSLKHKTGSSSSEGSSIYVEAKNSEAQESVTSTSRPTSDKQSMASSIIQRITSLVAGSDDDKQTSSLDTAQPPPTAKPRKENLDSVKKHPLYLFINDLLSTTHNISLPSHHLLSSLVITGPIPLPLFYVEELDNVVINAVYNQEKERVQAESPMKQLIKEGVIRKSCYPILYHKDLNTDYIDHSIQLMFVPKLICDAGKDEMDDTDKALSILSVQCALENILTNENKLSPIHLQYLLILCNQLHDVCSDVCSEELHEFGDQLLITNNKLKLRVALMASELKP